MRNHRRYTVFMVLLGLDVGDKRIGAAMATTEMSFATPIGVVHRTSSIEIDINQIVKLCDDYSPDKIVVGLPLLESGDEGEQARKTKSFCESLTNVINIPIVMIDERYSSYDAKALLVSANSSKSKRKKSIDAVAAVMILQQYMDQIR